MCLLDRANIETTPGENSRNPFCPPIGFKEDIDDYKKLVRTRYDSDFEVRQWMRSVASYSFRHQNNVRYTGPYAQQARIIVESLKPQTSTQEVA